MKRIVILGTQQPSLDESVMGALDEFIILEEKVGVIGLGYISNGLSTDISSYAKEKGLHYIRHDGSNVATRIHGVSQKTNISGAIIHLCVEEDREPLSTELEDLGYQVEYFDIDRINILT